MKMKTKKLLVLLVALLLASSALIAGCASEKATDGQQASGESQQVQNSQTTSGGTEDVAAKKTSLDKLTLQSLWLPQGQFAGYYVAKAKGFYEEEGIDLEILPGGTDVSSEEQVENDVAQIGIAFYSSVLTYQDGGYDLVNVFQTFQKSPQYLIAKKESGISSGKDLKGKKVGSWFGGRQYEFYALAQKYGYSNEDIDWVQQDYTMDQFYSGELDAASAMSYNEYLLVQNEGYTDNKINVLDMNEEGVALLEDCLFVKRSWAAANGDLLTRFIRASIKGWQYAAEHPDEVGQIVFDEGNSATLEHQIAMTKKTLEFVIPTGSDASQIGLLDRDKVQQTIDLGLKTGLIKTRIDIDSSIDSSYREAATAN